MTKVFESKADGAHALLSASGSHRWSTCPASIRLESALPYTSSKFADEGTAAHEVGSWCLINNAMPDQYPLPAVEVNGVQWPVTNDMKNHVSTYIEEVRGRVGTGSLLVEQKVNYSTWIDVEDSFGTSDSVILHDDRIEIVDLKYGMGVRVDATENEQLLLYALGALYEYEMLGDFKTVTTTIVQPRLNHVSDFEISVDDLKAFGERMQVAARRAMDVYEATTPPKPEDFKPSEDACRFCKAKATCPALYQEVETETRDLFAALVENGASAMAAAVLEDRLAQAMEKVSLIEDFCKAIRSETERRLLAGHPVPGFKLVEGRRGNREWTSEDEAEAALKSMRLKVDDMYDLKLKSPTKIEKVLKDNPRRWTKLQELISRSDGKPSVAPESDKRPALAITSVTDSFAALAVDPDPN